MANHTKLELIIEKMQYESFSNGYFHTVTISRHFVNIDDKKKVEIGRKAKILRNYFGKCPAAMHEITLYQRDRRWGNLSAFGSYGVGTAALFSGVFAAAKEGANTDVLWIRMGIGGGVMIAGNLGGWLLRKRANKHLSKSVEVYNTNCYVPLSRDTSSQVMPGSNK